MDDKNDPPAVSAAGVNPAAVCLAVLISLVTISPARADGPYTLRPGRETMLAAGGSVLLLCGSVLVRNMDVPDFTTLRRGDVPAVDRMALDRWSDRADRQSGRTNVLALSIAAAVAIQPVLRRDGLRSGEAFRNVVLFAETVMIEQGLTAMAKGAARRPRPYVYNPALSTGLKKDRGAFQSFWSGHTSSAFAAAVLAGTVFQAERPGSRLVVPVWIGGLSAAAATGALRVRAGRHFPTDVLAGAAAGSLVGWLVPRMHRDSVQSLRLTAGPGGDAELRFERRF